MSVTLTINGKSVRAPADSTILDAARLAGINIPTLCHHPDLSEVGACRLCVVSVEKARGVQIACTTPVAEGMVVDTESQAARETRRFVLEMLLTDHPNDCMTCEVNGDCALQDLVYDYDVPWPEHNGARHDYVIDPDPNPFIYIDLNKCILCGRCVRACSEIQNRDVWSFAHRGFKSKLVAGADQPMLDAHCESCGLCVAYCPVGALYDKMSLGLGRANQVTQVRTTCSYCGVGCNFDLNVRDGKIVRVTSAADAPVTDVDKQVASGKWQVAGTPIQKTSSDNGAMTPDTFIETDWDTALDVMTDKFTTVKRESGGDGFAVLASAKCTNEENYLFNKFTRQVLATNTIDHCARL
jgi:formate dehydrogenase alpha subunit